MTVKLALSENKLGSESDTESKRNVVAGSKSNINSKSAFHTGGKAK
jgi:hypothetical protein